MLNSENLTINQQHNDNDSFYPPPTKRIKCTFDSTSEDYNTKLFA
jgi:hypothetical protein